MVDDASSISPSIKSYVHISVSKDRLHVYVDFLDPPLLEENLHFQAKDLMDFISEEGIVYGVLEASELQKVMDDWICKIEGVEIAQGLMSTPSVDESFELLFQTDMVVAPKVKEDGAVDYRELNLLQLVSVDQKLAVKYPGINGNSGIDVYGRDIPVKPPKEMKLPAGKNTYVSLDGNTLFAEISGQIVYDKGKKVSVSDLYHVKENVDFSTGNIHFNGSVVIHGNVNAGFIVEADGNIEVMGIVEAANLHAKGDIVIRRGIQGSASTKIVAGGSVHALYLQNAVVHAEGNVFVSDSVINSFIQAHEVRISGKRGLLVGGVTRVKKGVSARLIGSHMGAKTTIELHYLKDLREQIISLELEQKNKMKNIANLDELLTQRTQLEQFKKSLTQEQLINKQKIMDSLAVEQSHLKEIHAKYQEVLEKQKASGFSYVEFGAVAYPGVIISTGDETMTLEEMILSGKIIQDHQGLHTANK